MINSALPEVKPHEPGQQKAMAIASASAFA